MELFVVPKSMPIDSGLADEKGMVFQNARFSGKEGSAGDQYGDIGCDSAALRL
jgi:hypothetical protein